jgi:transposase
MIIAVKTIRDIVGIVVNMTHNLDKETIKRILDLYEKQNLEPKIIAQRFGFSTSRVYNLIRRKSNNYERKHDR